jgi:hypothetical protein
MDFWIFLHSHGPFDHWMEGFEERFDAWHDAGVRGLVVGYLRFELPDDAAMPDGRGRQHRSVPVWTPDPAVYEAHGETPPEEEPRDPEREARFRAMLDDAASRGWQILWFCPPMSPAALQDLANQFPMVDGAVVDGPGENHYELAFHHGGELFEVRPGEDARFLAIGADLDRIHRGIAALKQSFQSLTPQRVRYLGPGGMLGGLTLFDLEEDSLYWLRQRRASSRHRWQENRAAVDAVDRPFRLGGIPRTATFSPLTGQDYEEMSGFYDLLFPKHYYWHRGFDGLYGTVARWVQRLRRWNPDLTEADALLVVQNLFGLQLPGVESLLDLEMGFGPEFFDQVVAGETRRALEAVGGDADRLIFWVSTGRAPHAGDAMTARDLHGILASARDAGMTRFLFHPDPRIGASEWRVLSSLCGIPWEERRGGWVPGAEDPSNSYSGQRTAPDEP